MSNRTLTIEAVEKAFQTWRINKIKPAEPIPDVLSNQVKILLQSYPPHKILGRLGITRLQAKNKGLLPQAITSKPKSQQAPLSSFVKIPVTQSEIDSFTQQNYPNLTLQRGDTKLSINHPSNDQIQLFINTILR